MPKIFSAVIVVCMVLLPSVSRAEFGLSTDTSDPLFMLSDDSVLSESAVSYGHEYEHDILRIGQAFSYGLNDRLSIGMRAHYQFDFTGTEDGFSSVDLGGVYRMARAEDNDSQLISDLILGFKFGGSRHVRTPEFADSTYYAGMRFGRQFVGVTLAGTVKSTWVFDDTRGMSFIDFIPETYFRLDENWRSGFGFTFRKSTNPDYNQEWLNLKIVCQFGRTQYAGLFDYEFESEEAQIGAQINILF